MSDLIIVKEFVFHAAHFLPNHEGACKNLHGHTYRLQIGISGPLMEDQGMIADFSWLKGWVQNLIIEELDHQCLNEVKVWGFPAHCPTAENMVTWMVERLVRPVFFADRKLALIRLWETDTSFCEWRA